MSTVAETINKAITTAVQRHKDLIAIQDELIEEQKTALEMRGWEIVALLIIALAAIFGWLFCVWGGR